MSLNTNGESCAFCKAYLFAEDDIVYCPVCGAPHHRDCYNSIGHCALEELHGTENEYSREKVEEELKQTEKKAKSEPKFVKDPSGVTCDVCGETYNPNSTSCPNCGRPNLSRIALNGGLDALGGVDSDYEIEDGVTAEDVKKFVLTNTHRYIPKFKTLNKKNRFSWNWMAFFFPGGWMLSRKIYKIGILFTIFSIAASILTIPFGEALYNLGVFEQNASYAERLYEVFPQINQVVLYCYLAGMIINIIIRIIAALLGDYIYKKHCINKIKIIKQDPNNNALLYVKNGGVNVYWFLLSLFALEYIPQILYSLI